MKREITLNIQRKKKAQGEEPQPTPEVYPTMLPTDDPLALKTEIQFFDGMTRKNESGAWEDVAEWNNDYDDDPGDDETRMTEAFTTSHECRGPWASFFLSPKDTTIKIYVAADSRSDPAVIEDEFGAQNEKRWERKPLCTMSEDAEQPGHRWAIGGSIEWGHTADEFIWDEGWTQANIHCELKTSKDAEAAYVIDPSRFHAKKAKKLKMKFPFHVEGIQPLIYEGFLDGKKGIVIKDLSKSWAHYLTDSDASYSYDWIDGVYFCPFDTTDDTHFKVTREPSFDAPEASGKFITEGKFECHLIPRRVALVSHYRHSKRTSSTTSYTLNEGCVVDFPGVDVGGTYIDACLKVGNCGNDPIYPYITESTYLVGIMYGRIPCNIKVLNFGSKDTGLRDTEGRLSYTNSFATQKFYDSTQYNNVGALVLTKDIIWEQNLDEAKASFIAAGGSEEDAEEIYSGGGAGNFHVLRDDTPYRAGVGMPTGYGSVKLDALRNASTCAPPFVLEDGLHASFEWSRPNPGLGPQYFFDAIENSNFWQTIVAPLRDAALAANASGDLEGDLSSSRIDMIPVGVGVCPSKAGSLVGVIRTGGQVWFIWRKTDEDFEEEGIIHTVGEGQAHLSFQSSNPDGRLDHFSEGKYVTAVADSLKAFDGDFCDQFVSDGTRKLLSVGRSVTFEDAGLHVQEKWKQNTGDEVPI